MQLWLIPSYSKTHAAKAALIGCRIAWCRSSSANREMESVSQIELLISINCAKEKHLGVVHCCQGKEHQSRIWTNPMEMGPETTLAILILTYG